jgi:hypothetical protein
MVVVGSDVPNEADDVSNELGDVKFVVLLRTIPRIDVLFGDTSLKRGLRVGCWARSGLSRISRQSATSGWRVCGDGIPSG